jgi:hypothetical protein
MMAGSGGRFFCRRGKTGHWKWHFSGFPLDFWPVLLASGFFFDQFRRGQQVRLLVERCTQPAAARWGLRNGADADEE